ncbi:PREDICTED: transcription factor GTE4-like isoform X3 [Lupinus angustifolius]|uniref:transcription factor GTE4-like isoform X3 n=1 Tax=Lupinus angustifolius TaxID=3871 RepID=UPI00092F334D|nr:PREDICTED: transcription factor GTE4-like isoform X3 [Lupinus angustifolius]
MASGHMVGGDDGDREKKRFLEGKVYTRRKFKSTKKDPSIVNTVTAATTLAENDSATIAATTTANFVINNNSTVKCGDSDKAKSNSNIISGIILPVAVPEDGNSAQPQVSSAEDRNSAQPQVNSGEGEDLTQTQVCSREDEKLAQEQVNSREYEYLAKLPVNSTLDDEGSAQPQTESMLEDGNSAQPEVDTTLGDENSAKLQMDSTLEDEYLAKLPVNSTLDDEGSAQPQTESMLEDGNSAQPEVDTTLGDENSAKLQMDSTLEDEYLAKLPVNSTLDDEGSAQPQTESMLEDGNSAQPEVDTTLGDENSAKLQMDSTLEDGNSAQHMVVLVSDDLCSRQQDDGGPSSPYHWQDAVPMTHDQTFGNGDVELRQDDDGTSSPSHQQEMIPSSQDMPSGNGDLVLQQDGGGHSSHSHRLDMVPCMQVLPSGNGTVEPWMVDPMKISLISKSKQEKQELRWKLEDELNVVRSLVRRIELKQGQAGRYGTLNVSMGGEAGNGRRAVRAHSEVASAGVPRESTRPLQQLSFSMLENSHGANENVEREKRTPKANQFYCNSEFLLAKDKFPPVESNKKSKLHWKKQGGGEMGHGLGMASKFFKSCSSLLEKLMKHKHGWVFNAPVDVEGLGLHDYFTIITHPMDFGTVKSRLSKNWYKSPKEFAEDVRLTFRNAMTYNPKGQDVHVMAEQLSKIFEERWVIIESDYNREVRYGIEYGATPTAPSPLSRKVSAFPPAPLDMRRILNRSEPMTQTPRPMSITPSSRTPAPKKPKAKDPHKRDMTFEEKQKLSTNLQSLPSDKLDAIVQIIKKRNSALHHHDDEIEVDIDSVDAETLWELDRFVTNYKKSLSKNKRKAELARARAIAVQNAIQKSRAPVVVEVPRETQADERNDHPSMPVHGGNHADNGSRSSSTSSSSSDSGSSSSDSDSDSSSTSGSDEGPQRT